MNLETACGIIGEETVVAIAQRLISSRSKHPDNGGGKGLSGSVWAIQDEASEVTKAALFENDERVRDECLDVIATGVRCYNGEYA